jgi:hypothetical protein
LDPNHGGDRRFGLADLPFSAGAEPIEDDGEYISN